MKHWTIKTKILKEKKKTHTHTQQKQYIYLTYYINKEFTKKHIDLVPILHVYCNMNGKCLEETTVLQNIYGKQLNTIIKNVTKRLLHKINLELGKGLFNEENTYNF